MIPASHIDLLTRPLICDLSTVRPDGAVQSNPMWFLFDGINLRFSHTNRRAKYRNLQSNPHMTTLIVDPLDTQRYLELRGRLAESLPDPTGAFHQVLAVRYGEAHPAPPPNAAERVILVMEIETVRARELPAENPTP